MADEVGMVPRNCDGKAREGLEVVHAPSEQHSRTHPRQRPPANPSGSLRSTQRALATADTKPAHSQALQRTSPLRQLTCHKLPLSMTAQTLMHALCHHRRQLSPLRNKTKNPRAIAARDRPASHSAPLHPRCTLPLSSSKPTMLPHLLTSSRHGKLHIHT